MRSPRNKRLLLGALAALVVLLLGGGLWWQYVHEQNKLRTRAETLTGGSAVRGQHLFIGYGCGGCHAVKGVGGARGLVGPPLDGTAARSIIAGRLQNTPHNLERWIADPQGVSPGTAMPNLGVEPQESRDIAAFLYTRS